MSLVSEADDLTAEEKYTVRNAEGEILAPGTYFVIRATDVFAAAGLWSYVHSMETVLEIDTDTRFLTPEQRAHLRATADQATRLATNWQHAGLGRMPD